mmetsp:Transcript_35176/g.112433  ORF Transcript_35176/g.112433 Transcript_35176/m.112433 type:complete len:226 (-) Transcript_35176:203-880(-)
MYRSTPPRTIVMSLIRKVGSALTISSSRAVARSHRMPPVQYMSTFLPESASLVFSSASHFGNSRLLRIFGSSSVAPPSGGAKWPIADSYAFRTSITTASGCLSSSWYSVASTCLADDAASAGARSPARPYATSSSVLRTVSALKRRDAGRPSVNLKSVWLKSSGFHARSASQKARRPAALPVSVQLRPSLAQRPRPQIECSLPKARKCFSAEEHSLSVHGGSTYW